MHDIWLERRRTFRKLHQSGCLLLPNPWDAGGAARLEAMGFKALASSSSACAMALGRSDYQITLDEALTHLQSLAAATSLPLNADFENGFADAPEAIAKNVLRAAATGIAGVSIEDQRSEQLYDTGLSIERIRAARQALDAGAPEVLLVARCEAYLLGQTDPRLVIDRLVQYADAGADCLYAPGVVDLPTIRAIVAAVAPRPVNVLMYQPQQRVDELVDAGVRRISLGGVLAHASWRAFEATARNFLTRGSLSP
ncbi:MAG: isocitrate lyase/phosphoenolpyruvate mutase family protein [Steroidobacteraceae bacterium]